MKRWACALCHQSNEPHRRRDICDICDDGLVVRELAWCTKGRHRVALADMATGKTLCKTHEAERRRKYPDKRHRIRKSVPLPYDAARRRRYYLKHRKKEIARAKKRYRANREAQKERNREWRKKNAEHMRAYRRERYIAEKLRAWKRAA